ncbi:PREDICTED: probable mediator of RNA polymerase II transcription subunit 19b isoform X2 [Camelina sativa]|uniref:Probable mediator of RNA polymerase II transcription subunit 19b isoform X2 n=1 Tax=Camelina sativa TaxID=90675 RepID=A0ABM0T4H0_CAMSA|nr:PREDICTED: probable mediator of RNA polymerase II transcription subunit 19b isoform X2 [Camelina sativa]
MESESNKFGGPRELGGALDLITQYKLLPHLEFFCKRSLPESLSDAHYLHSLVGDSEIRKGEGMQLDQLIPNASLGRDTSNNARIQPFVLDELKEAFELNDTAPVELPPAEKGAPTIASKSKSESKDKDRKHKKHRDKNKEKDREHKKHKHKHKVRSKDKDKDKDRERKKEKSGHHDKKRKSNGDADLDDVQRHKKSKVMY